MTAGKQSFDPDRAPGFKEDFKVRRELALELRRLREAAGMTQGAAAAQATFTSGTWSNMELMRYQVSRLEYLMAAFRVVGKRLVITIEDIPGPLDAALEEEYAAWAETLKEEVSGTNSDAAMDGELLRPPAPVDEEESLGSLARRAFEESQERLSGVHTA